MSRAFKILVNLIVIVFIVAAAALVIPPLVGVSTSVIDSEIDSNMDVGSVAYGVRRPIASLEAGTDQIVYSGEDFTYLYYVDKVDTANGEVYATDVSTDQQSVLQIPKNATKLVFVVPYIGYGLMAVYSENGIYALISLAAVLVMLLIVANVWFRRKHPSDDGYTDEDDDDYFAALAQSIDRKPSGLDNIQRSPSASATGTIPAQNVSAAVQNAAAAAPAEFVISNAEPVQAVENTAPLPEAAEAAAPVNNEEAFVIPDAAAAGAAAAGVVATSAAEAIDAAVAASNNNAEAAPVAAVAEAIEEAAGITGTAAESPAKNIQGAVEQAVSPDAVPETAAQAEVPQAAAPQAAAPQQAAPQVSAPQAAAPQAKAQQAAAPQQAAPQQAAPQAAAPQTIIDDEGVPAYVPPANSPYNTGNIAAAFAEIPEENSAASLDLDENVIPDVSEALVAALATTNVSRSERAYTQNIPQPVPEVQEEEQLDEIELAIPVKTADEILGEAYSNGLDPKVSADEVTGVKFIDFSDSL